MSDPIQHLQEQLEASLETMNREAMKTLAAQIVATVEALRNGEPFKTGLLYDKDRTPEHLHAFIIKHVKSYDYVIVLPPGITKSKLELVGLERVELDLPQNKLLIFKKTI